LSKDKNPETPEEDRKKRRIAYSLTLLFFRGAISANVQLGNLKSGFAALKGPIDLYVNSRARDHFRPELSQSTYKQDLATLCCALSKYDIVLREGNRLVNAWISAGVLSEGGFSSSIARFENEASIEDDWYSEIPDQAGTLDLWIHTFDQYWYVDEVQAKRSGEFFAINEEWAEKNIPGINKQLKARFDI